MGTRIVVFACTHSAGRSQMAAAFFNAIADGARVEAISAGLDPAPAVYPEVIAAMREVGVDLSDARPRLLTAVMQADAEYLVTMGCGERCPAAPPHRRTDWPLPDPRGLPAATVRAIRDDIRARVAALVRERGWSR